MLDLALVKAKERLEAARLFRGVEAHVFAIRAAIPKKFRGAATILERVADAGARLLSRPVGETRVEVSRLLAVAVARPRAVTVGTLCVDRNGCFARATLVFQGTLAIQNAPCAVAFSFFAFVAARPLLVAIAPAVRRSSAQMLAVVLRVLRAADGRYDGYPTPNPAGRYGCQGCSQRSCAENTPSMVQVVPSPSSSTSCTWSTAS